MSFLSTSLLTLAVGASVLVVAPAQAADYEITGPRCSHTASNDPTGIVNQDPNSRFGELHGGPVVVTSGGNLANPVTLICTIQVNNSNPAIENAKAAVYSGPGVGAAYIPPTAISYVATRTDNVYECTGFWFKLPDGTWIHKWDECQLALSAG